MAIQGPALSEMTNTVLGTSGKPKPAIHMAVHRQTTINRDRVNTATQPVTQQSENIVVNEGGIIGTIPEGRPNYFHSSVDPLPFMHASNDVPPSPTPVVTLYDLVAVMDASMKPKAFYRAFMDLISPSNIGSIRYQRFMQQHAGFVVYCAYTSNGNIFDYGKFRTALFYINGIIKNYFVANGKPMYDNWMREYDKLLIKLN